MATRIRWAHPFKIREIHGFVFQPGQVHVVEDDTIALDILTQPGEPFEEAEPDAPDCPEVTPIVSPAEVKPTKKRQSKAVQEE